MYLLASSLATALLDSLSEQPDGNSDFPGDLLDDGGFGIAM
jgi:hypothetical protein